MTYQTIYVFIFGKLIKHGIVDSILGTIDGRKKIKEKERVGRI